MPTGKKLSDDLKRQALEAVIANDGSHSKAARQLRITLQTLSSRLRSAGYVAGDGLEALQQLLAGLGRPQPPSSTGTQTSDSATSQIELLAKIEDLKAQLEAVTIVKRWARAKAPKRPAKPQGSKHMFLCDTQVKVGVPVNHLPAAGNYAAEKRPDTIVIAGDWWDMPSLSSYDRGKLCFEGRRYRLDVEAGKEAMSMFLAPIRKVRGYDPRIIFLMGNHEERIERARQETPALDGLIGYHDLQLQNFGLEVHDFLSPVVVDGVAYCHYFPRSASGNVAQSKRGAPSAKAQLIREGRSCFAGHQQGLDMHCQPIGGRLQWGVIAGSFYQHDESYLTPQGNDHWRGIVMSHEVRDGYLNPMVVSLDYLLKKYS
jgi:transposase-like protein